MNKPTKAELPEEQQHLLDAVNAKIAELTTLEKEEPESLRACVQKVPDMSTATIRAEIARLKAEQDE